MNSFSRGSRRELVLFAFSKFQESLAFLGSMLPSIFDRWWSLSPKACLFCLPLPHLETPVMTLSFPGSLAVTNSPANAGDTVDTGLIPGSGRSPGRGNGNPFQYSVWEILWTEVPGGLQSMWLQIVRHDWGNWARPWWHWAHLDYSISSLLLQVSWLSVMTSSANLIPFCHVS